MHGATIKIQNICCVEICFVFNPRLMNVVKADKVMKNETLLDKEVTKSKNKCMDWVCEI
jgi:hypothetical protein